MKQRKQSNPVEYLQPEIKTVLGQFQTKGLKKYKQADGE